MSQWMLHYAQLSAVLAVCIGCSVGMAMSGKEAPNLGAFRVGSPRGQVELQLGSPIASTTEPDGTRTDLYEYELGNEPSAGRAVGHAVMDVLTLELWEVVGTPIEAFQGQTRRVAITYDRHDRVLALNNPTTPMLTPQRLTGSWRTNGNRAVRMRGSRPSVRFSNIATVSTGRAVPMALGWKSGLAAARSCRRRGNPPSLAGGGLSARGGVLMTRHVWELEADPLISPRSPR